jgi:hypothetical protein
MNRQVPYDRSLVHLRRGFRIAAAAVAICAAVLLAQDALPGSAQPGLDSAASLTSAAGALASPPVRSLQPLTASAR